MGGSGSGRRGKPTAAHILHGTLRSDRHSERIDNSLYSGFPSKPDGLDELASQLWDALEPQLRGSNCVKEVDATNLEAMCRYWSLWKRSTASLENGAADEGKESVINARYWRAFTSLAIRFGFTPADRLRLSQISKGDGKGEHYDPLKSLGIVG